MKNARMIFQLNLLKFYEAKAVWLLFNLLRICLTMGLLAFCILSFFILQQ